MAAGRALSASLTDPASGSEQLAWTLTDADDASSGLSDGTYYAVLTIPSDFSAAIVSTGRLLAQQREADPAEQRRRQRDRPLHQQRGRLRRRRRARHRGDAVLPRAGVRRLQPAGQRQPAGGAGCGPAGWRHPAARRRRRATSTPAPRSSRRASARWRPARPSSRPAPPASAAARSELRQGSRELAGGVGRLDRCRRRPRRRRRPARPQRRHLRRPRHSATPRRRPWSPARRTGSAWPRQRLSDQLGDLVGPRCRASGATIAFCADAARGAHPGAGRQPRQPGARRRQRPGSRRAPMRSPTVPASSPTATARWRAAPRRSRAPRGGSTAVPTRSRGAPPASRPPRRRSTLATGQLAGGTVSASEAGSSLASGSDTLSSSAAETDHGAQKLSQGLDKQARQSPTYSKSREDGTGVDGQPAGAAEPQHPVPGARQRLAARRDRRRDPVAGRPRRCRPGRRVGEPAVRAAPVSSRRIAISQVLPVLGLALLQGVAVLLALALTRVSVASAVVAGPVLAARGGVVLRDRLRACGWRSGRPAWRCSGCSCWSRSRRWPTCCRSRPHPGPAAAQRPAAAHGVRRRSQPAGVRWRGGVAGRGGRRGHGAVGPGGAASAPRRSYGGKRMVRPADRPGGTDDGLSARSRGRRPASPAGSPSQW